MACNGPTHVRIPSSLSHPPQPQHFLSFPDQPFHHPFLIVKHPSNTLTGGGTQAVKNRTYWPTTGGAVAFQPGWFRGHETAFLYVNLGFGTDGPWDGPRNMSSPMVPIFQLLGPSNGAYPGTVCLPQVPMPVNASVKAGDMATIQVVETAQHGASLYSVSFHHPNPIPLPLCSFSGNERSLDF